VAPLQAIDAMRLSRLPCWTLVPLHPDLRRKDAIDRYVGFPLILAVAFWLFSVVFLLYDEARERLSAAAWGVLFILAAIGFIVLSTARLAWKRRQWYERLSALLERPAVEMRVRFTSGPGRTVIANLDPVDGRSDATAVLMHRPRFDITALDGTVIRAHRDRGSGGPVVLSTPLGPLWPLDQPPQRRKSPPDLSRAVELLRSAGWNAEADELESVITAAYTTSSELIGEIAAVVERLQRRNLPLPAEVEEIFEAMMDHARRAFPGR
jgi:hypothetical protein